MKTAYIMTAHEKPELVARCVKKLLEYKDSFIYIHIDRKSDDSPFRETLAESDRVFFIPERHDVTWGGFSQVEAMIDLMRNAVRNEECERIVFLQSQTYPLRPMSEINEFFESEGVRGKEFVGGTDMTIIDRSRHQNKFAYNWDLDDKSFPAGLRRKTNTVRLKLKLPSRYRKCHIDIDGKQGHFFAGRAYIAITHAAAKYCVDFYDSHDSFNERFRRVYAPDESYFQTVLLNSSFRDSMYYETCQHGDDPRWYNITYYDYGIKPVVQRDTSLVKRLENTDYLFFRKFDLPESAELLDYIDSLGE